MKTLFVHHPLFRLLGPTFSGVIVYVLILLINNNVDQLQEEFLGQELYVCIGLSYLIQELSRWLLLFFDRRSFSMSRSFRLLMQISVSVCLCILLVTGSIFWYYHSFIGFSPNWRELNIFNAIFSTITLIYILLYISHQFLYRRNSEKLTREMLIKEGIEEDFRQFKRGINTDLLFESLESLIVLMRQHKDKADDLLHALSIVYRYILSEKKMELVPFAEECRIVDQLVSLFNHLPYRQIDIQSTNGIQAWVVPGALLAIVESIIRSSIASAHAPLLLQVEETKEYILIHYEPHERLEADGAWDKLEAVRDSYAVYTDQLLKVASEAGRQQIFIPKLILDH